MMSEMFRQSVRAVFYYGGQIKLFTESESVERDLEEDSFIVRP